MLNKWKLRQAHGWIDDLGRVGGFLFVRFAADVLPASWGRASADLVGGIRGSLPTFGRQLRPKFQRQFDMDAEQAARATNDYLARPYHNYLTLRRLINGRDKWEEWLFEERNVEAVQDLRDSGTSFIVATGHFTRDAALIMHSEKIIPHNIYAVVKPHAPITANPRTVRLRLHFGQILEVLEFLIREDVTLVFPGSSKAWKELIRCLRKPGNAAVIAVDAPWKGKDGFTRPFNGKSAQRFSKGTARLARLIQCPIVVCVPYVDEDGKVVVNWRRRIDPPDPTDEEADLSITNMMLDEIEKATAERPSQYVMALFD